MRDHSLVQVDGRRQLGTPRAEAPRAEFHEGAVTHPGPPSDFPPLRSPDALPNNLPPQLSSFVGRKRELAEVGRLISEHRLVTLTGPGGCGKTRLATQAASEALERFPDGTWWVDLASVSDERLVGAAIAEVLGVRPLPGMTEIQAVGAYLASREALILLDNCEHLLKACAEAAEALIDAAPEVVVLATSRAPLAASGESEWQVPPLSLPGESTERLGASDAVALFMERAAPARPGLTLGADDAEHVAAICTELDGLPLAIELAAARLRILSVAQIAAGLSDRFRLLSGGPHTATPRLKTIRASVDWSHELLSEPERALLRRLAVFAGGFNLEAIDAVCVGEPVGAEGLLDLLASLVEQSLLVAEERDSAVRYRLLETVRQYGFERLAEAGEDEKIRARHRDHFLVLAEEAKPHLESSSQPEWVRILNLEAANLAAAIDYALSSKPELALRFGASLYRWWHASGRFAEAELAYSRAFDACGSAEPGIRARALECRAAIASIRGAFEVVEAQATEALALADEAGDQATAARARLQLSVAATRLNPRAARMEAERASELARAADDQWAFVEAGQFVCEAYIWQQDHEHARRASDAVAALAERQGDPFQVAKRWWYVSLMAWIDGRMAEAREAAERVHAAVEGVGEPIMEASADQCLGALDMWEGKPERAVERMNRRLERAIGQGAALAVPILLTGIAWAELALDRVGEARSRLEGVVALIEGRWAFISTWALGLLAEALRLQSDGGAEPTARRAQATAEEIGNRFFATRARLTLCRLAAARGQLTEAREHALAHLDACVEGGHATSLPPCLDALAEVATGAEAYEDAVRLLAAAERARAEIGIVRVPSEEGHWTAIDKRPRAALEDEVYQAARAQGAAMSTADAVEWARRARGPRGRPPGGWDSLTPTELRVVELVAEGLTNPQVAEQMFVAPSTVKTHLAHIFRKLDVNSRAELSARAGERHVTG